MHSLYQSTPKGDQATHVMASVWPLSDQIEGSFFFPDKRDFPFSSSGFGSVSHTRRYLIVCGGGGGGGGGDISMG